MTRRPLAAALAVAMLALAAPAMSQTTPDASTRSSIAAACRVPPLLLERTLRGYRPDRAGELQLVPEEPDFVGHGGLPHSGPWDYISQVPLLWYGPGHVPATGEIDRRVTLADVAPTQGQLIGFDFPAPDGRPLREVLAGDAAEPPAVVVVVVWDGAGTAVLEEHADAWPNLRQLIDEGVYYTRAEVGSSPPSTAQIHATIGTGAFSRTHGLIAHRFRMGDALVDPWAAGPRYLVRPTLADLYDRATGNRALVGVSATVAIHLGMVGHGTMWGGGDADLVVLREREGAATLGAEGDFWNLTSNVAPWFSFPAYVNDLPPVLSYAEPVDRVDGRVDGRWRDLEIDSDAAHHGFRTPARIPYQTRLVEELLRREGFGRDDVPDLLYVNYKLIDEVGHVYSMNSVEMEDSIAAEDANLPALIDVLDREVGEGRWVMALTADHGHTPDPDVSGAAAISPTHVGAVLRARFDTDGDDVSVVELVQPTTVFLNEAELADEGVTVADVAAYTMTLTKGQLSGETWPIPAAQSDEPAFLAAFPSDVLPELPCLPASTRG
ncbi:MAG TPA: alkaline phosphatase family protein [Actinomycetota bacterium]|nr:alkaline phosphatase family protein [Actinomycetota bacterium]